MHIQFTSAVLALWLLPYVTPLSAPAIDPNNPRAPAQGTAAITFRVRGHSVEATLRAPRQAFANLPQRAPAAVVAGSCAVRVDDLVLRPEGMTVQPSASTDSLVTATVRYEANAAPKTLDVSCAMFPTQLTAAPRPNLVVVLAGDHGKTAVISANSDGRVDAGIRMR